MKGFEIYYSDKNISVENVKKAVKVEFEGTDALLGYRAIQKKLRQVGNIRVSRRDLVHNMMYCVDPETLEARAPGRKKKQVISHRLCQTWYIHLKCTTNFMKINTRKTC